MLDLAAIAATVALGRSALDAVRVNQAHRAHLDLALYQCDLLLAENKQLRAEILTLREELSVLRKQLAENTAHTESVVAENKRLHEQAIQKPTRFRGILFKGGLGEGEDFFPACEICGRRAVIGRKGTAPITCSDSRCSWNSGISNQRCADAMEAIRANGGRIPEE